LTDATVHQKNTLEPRRKPAQARSRQRVEGILDAVAELLVERGFDAITTRLMADRAGIPVGSIYQFFPNKYAIFNALGVRYLDRFAQVYKDIVTAEIQDEPWDELLDRAIDAFSKVIYAERGAVILWEGMRNSPELRAAEAQHRASAVDYNLAILDRVLPHLEPQRRCLIAWVMVRVLDALLYQASREEDERKAQVIAELKQLMKAYVASHLPAEDGSCSGRTPC